MGKIYARTILRGTRKLRDVPQTWYAATLDALYEMCDEDLMKQLLEESGITAE